MASSDLCQQLRVYVVIDPALCHWDPLETCRQALSGGATAIQLRSKQMTDRETLELAERMRAETTQSDGLFIVNDRLDIALACGADGVHLGVDDLPVSAARSLSGGRFIIGYSPEHDEQAALAGSQGADYLGVGPVFGTTSKHDAGPAIGLETMARRKDLSELPVIGIGGVNQTNAGQVIEAGACGVAVMSSIIMTASPAQSTREIVTEVSAALQSQR
jgi:thiamine-phosphate diphosphorylase